MVKKLKPLYETLRNKFHNSDTVEAFTENYYNEFPDIFKRHVFCIAEFIDSSIIASFSKAKTAEQKRDIAIIIKNISECSIEDRRSSECINNLYWLSKEPKNLQEFLTKRGYTSPENIESHIPVINKIIEERSELIGNYVINIISHVDKYAPGRESGDNTRKRKWVDRVSKGEDHADKKVMSKGFGVQWYENLR